VRADLGNTAVNRSIGASMKQRHLHKAFPLFHNGITVLAKSGLRRLSNELLGKYVLTKYVMLLVVRKVLDLSEAGRAMIDFDYRDKLRDKDYVSGLVKTLVASYSKDLLRKRIAGVAELWARF
jgi:hypothetical protein